MIVTHDTRARLQLLAALQITTRRAIALRCRVSISAVSRWASGENIPDAFPQSVLASSYGIPEDGWFTPRQNRKV